jgi:hypothetical protein
MTTARDNISQIIDEMVRYDGFMGAWDAHDAADEILAALPDMIAPLIWDKHPDQHEWYNVTHMDIDGIEYGYTIAGVRSKWAVYLRFGNKRVGGLHRVPQEAFDWANTHHRAAIMASFQTPTITP